MSDLIIEGAKGIPDGLYVIKDGEMFKYKSKGGTVRIYPIVDRPQKAIAQITFDEEKLREIVKEAVERFKEEYEITDRPRGEWITEEEYGDLWVCDQCGFANEHNDNFCPNCGADMRSE